MSWSVTASDTSVASVTLASTVTVLVAAIAWSSGTLTYCRWDGTDMDLLVSVTFNEVACAIFAINNPAIVTGAITSDITMDHANAISIVGTRGETYVAGDTDSVTHTGNDFMVASVTSSVDDIVIYMGDKNGGGAWTGVDNNYGNAGATETAVGSPTAGTFGDADDARMCLIAVALGVKPLAKMAGIITI